MSEISTLVPVVKELGFAGIAIYALYVMNNLNTSIKTMEVTLQTLCNKVLY